MIKRFLKDSIAETTKESWLDIRQKLREDFAEIVRDSSRHSVLELEKFQNKIKKLQSDLIHISELMDKQ